MLNMVNRQDVDFWDNICEAGFYKSVCVSELTGDELIAGRLAVQPVNAGMSMGAVAGSVGGGLFGAGLLTAAGVMFMAKKKAREGKVIEHSTLSVEKGGDEFDAENL
jgi:hypothetical protein